jgi:hypothetical protein
VFINCSLLAAPGRELEPERVPCSVANLRHAPAAERVARRLACNLTESTMKAARPMVGLTMKRREFLLTGVAVGAFSDLVLSTLG